MKANIRVIVLWLIVVTICAALVQYAFAQTTSRRPVDFNREIRPIVSENCFACHGADETQRKAKLRLDTREGAFMKAAVIVPGDSAESRLIQRVTAEDPAKVMPPPESGHKLTDAQIELLRRWIDEGAKWETHWAYKPPEWPEVPQVRNREWVRNKIDNFILARLDKIGLKPSPEADKTTLLRRVYFDLTGLPPTPAEIDSFLADESPDAYDKRVDQLLASSHYGERMAMEWLDLARYADTHGYHVDNQRDMWAWRDWVIKAFNQNEPFDQFTIEQLAGDLLPNATLDQKIASGFNRNHMINFEGGAIPEEYQLEYVVDRVETTATTWMGMTMGCARCHDHKYDPITQKEFYQFSAFFNTVSEEGIDGYYGNAKPYIQLPTEKQKVRLDELNAAIKERETTLEGSAVKQVQDDWEKLFSGKVAETPRDGLTAQYEMDGSFADISGHYQHGRTISGSPEFVTGRIGKAASFDGDSHVSFGNVGSFDRDQPFSLTVWFMSDSNVPMDVFQKIQDPETRRGYELHFDDLDYVGQYRLAGHLTIRLISRWPNNTLEIRTKQKLALGERFINPVWSHLALTWNGSGKGSGLKLYVNGKPYDTEVVRDTLSGSIRSDADFQIGNKKLGSPFSGKLDDLRFYDRELTAGEVEQIAIRYPFQATLSGVFGKETKEERERVRDYFLTYAAPEPYRQTYVELKNLKTQRDALNKAITTVMVMDEMEKPRETFVLARGDYRNRTEKVSPGVPAALPPIRKEPKVNRLTLAKWLVDPANPLTARVTVNRYWQMYFGIGIVKTSENFGSRGELPTHPDLLDWLASEFIRSGWDVKAIQRLIVTSATYRQSSKVSPELLQKDPENRLLARGPRFRLPAEMVRDLALAASGLLNETIGGPSVFSYQPKGLWEEVAFGEGYTAQAYTPSSGRDLYRRSMYSFWKRAVPPPSLAVFDAPNREKCTTRRMITNTPLQALVLLNDQTYVEAARALAQRAMNLQRTDADTRIAYVFRLVTARWPSAAEVRPLRTLFQQQLAQYRLDNKAAQELLRIGESQSDPRFATYELAAWTIVASAVLNLDETVTKE